MSIETLVLGAGKHQRIEGARHHDIYPFEGINLVFDLNEKKWPIEDNSFDSIVATHVIEHVDDFIHFHNECHRILRIGGTLYLETPCAGLDLDLEFADPTHKRCYLPHSWINYMTIEGIAKFGYTDKCWGNLHIEIKDNSLIVHAMPIKL